MENNLTWEVVIKQLINNFNLFCKKEEKIYLEITDNYLQIEFGNKIFKECAKETVNTIYEKEKRRKEFLEGKTDDDCWKKLFSNLFNNLIKSNGK
jgi:hypothetical protein